MYTLGINAAFHDSSAALLADGKIVAAAEEERFTQIKHGKRPVPFSAYELPFNAINYCLEKAGINLADVSHIGYSFDPYLLLQEDKGKARIEIPLEPDMESGPSKWTSPWDPLFLSAIVNAPGMLLDGYPHHLQKRFKGAVPQNLQWHFVEHHEAHAASAFYPSPFDESAVMVLDGRGELATTSYSYGAGMDLERISQVDMPHSLGLLYERVTSYLGFLHSSDEYKVMALASYGKPVFLNDFRQMIRIGSNGQYQVSDERLEERFGPMRRRDEPFTTHHFNIASSLQVALEESVLELASYMYNVTGSRNLCLAGGVALNCVLNARIRDYSPFEGVWVQPAAGDAGTSLGAAIAVEAKQEPASDRTGYRMPHAYYGPEYGDEEVERFLKWSKVPYRRLANIAEETADILLQDKIIGWFQGGMEFGPRALGSRSILASPINASMQQRLNEVKDREDFRPVAPAVLESDAGEWFSNASASTGVKMPGVRHTVFDDPGFDKTVIPHELVKPADMHEVYPHVLHRVDCFRSVPAWRIMFQVNLWQTLLLPAQQLVLIRFEIVQGLEKYHVKLLLLYLRRRDLYYVGTKRESLPAAVVTLFSPALRYRDINIIIPH